MPDWRTGVPSAGISASTGVGASPRVTFWGSAARAEPEHDKRSERRTMSTTMTEPRELFLHELGDLLYAENLLVKALPKMAQEAGDADLAGGFEDHLEETREHVKVLEQVFESIGESPKAEKCPGIEGIKTEHDKFFADHETAPEIADLFLAGAGARAEHYEIAAYSGLITMANALGESEAAELLERNLKQEQAALRKLETATERLSKSAGNGSA
jgi:ferritin-like metal-binding protein YciE